jgi:formylglycine-generating enzyme required for sulfatase activity
MSEGRSAHETRQPPVVAGGALPAGSRSVTAEPEGARVVAGEAAWAALAAEPDLEVPLPVPAGQAALALRFRRIPAGAFVMGSRGNNPNEEPPHRVILPHDFWLGKFVVTQEEWQALVEACGPAGLEASPSRFKGQRRPVETVSWDDVQAWCQAWHAWLRQDGHAPSLGLRELRLPSEAEREYACRAGSETDFWNGDGEAALREVGWFGGNAGGETHDVDEPVVAGSPERHPACLVGMHGNVWEWCGDCYDRGAYRARPDGWPAEKPWSEWDEDSKEYRSRVIRGGAWRYTAGGCRSAYRLRLGPGGRLGDRGFRVCLVRGPAARQEQAGGGADPGKRGAEVEQAQQDKAGGARPPSGAAGETGAGGRAQRRAAAGPPAAQPRGAKKKPARRQSKGAAPPRQPKGATVTKSPRAAPRSKQPQAGRQQPTRKPAEQVANKSLQKSTKKSTQKPVKKAVKKLPRSRPKTPKSPGPRPAGKKPKG